MQDPNKAVNGAGRKELLDAGMVVEHGLMAHAAEELNPGFLQRMRLGRPFVRVKMAASLDGRTALANGTSQWITGEAARQDVQRWRARSSAILTGIGTVLADNPRMTVRLPAETMQPVRVVVDSDWRTPPDSKIVKQAGKTIIAGSVEKQVPKALLETGVQCLPLANSLSGLDLLQLMQALAAESLNEVQVEAGAMLCGSLLREGLVDELLLYQAPVLLGDAGPGLFAGPALESMQQKTQMQLIESCFIGSDQRLRLRPVKAEKAPV
jgi:diaminohydroxyphosphoribosylaminopyrimidine deaminase/5-amino-6-(5-phosphoribosylamino)uracil reductase